MQAYYKRRGQGSNWLSKLLLALALLVPALVGLISGKWMVSLGFGLGSAAALMSLLWWTLLLSSVIQQNFPVAYYLVPDMRRRSLMVLAGTALLIVVVHVLLFAMGGIAPALTAAIVTLALATMAAAMLIPAVQVLLSGGLIVQLIFDLSLPPALDGWIAQHYLIGTTMVLLVYALLAAWQWRRRGVNMLTVTPLAKPRAGGWYGWRLRRDCLRQNIAALLMHASGAGSFASLWVFPMLSILLLAAIAQALLGANSPWVSTTKSLVIIAAICGQWVVAWNVVAAMRMQRAGQALVRLSALSPPAAHFNRILGQALLRDFALFWAVSSGGTLLFFAVSGVNGAGLLSMGAVFVMNLSLEGLVLSNYAQETPEAPRMRLLVCGYIVVAVLLAGNLPRLRVSINAGLTMLVVASVASALLLVLRARWFARLPVAFPAARQ
ncbi:MAG TPA: hypothetical protein VFS95_03355 [Telluria sp.]|nr:hypothetical protein [Telluria sp.]